MSEHFMVLCVHEAVQKSVSGELQSASAEVTICETPVSRSLPSAFSLSTTAEVFRLWIHPTACLEAEYIPCLRTKVW